MEPISDCPSRNWKNWLDGQISCFTGQLQYFLGFALWSRQPKPTIACQFKYTHWEPKCCYQDIKEKVNYLLNSSDASSVYLVVVYGICFIFNCTALSSLDWRTPFEQFKGHTPDISMILHFKFWDPILYKHDESRGGRTVPSESNEVAGCFVGFSE